LEGVWHSRLLSLQWGLMHLGSGTTPRKCCPSRLAPAGTSPGCTCTRRACTQRRLDCVRVLCTAWNMIICIMSLLVAKQQHRLELELHAKQTASQGWRTCPGCRTGQEGCRERTRSTGRWSRRPCCSSLGSPRRGTPSAPTPMRWGQQEQGRSQAQGRHQWQPGRRHLVQERRHQQATRLALERKR
jgi:hypothetical protein